MLFTCVPSFRRPKTRESCAPAIRGQDNLTTQQPTVWWANSPITDTYYPCSQMTKGRLCLDDYNMALDHFAAVSCTSFLFCTFLKKMIKVTVLNYRFLNLHDRHSEKSCPLKRKDKNYSQEGLLFGNPLAATISPFLLPSRFELIRSSPFL
ncbi:hypothetical protein DAPPUDRAFT_262094 [Daphnia pulex]|uniref:Uncharacterized protein n=1 Tax=Daphnia pulex TaxID=6669 RepID=E9HMC1_DAPPU|nr:hypothetical protein DAPPUDRAFT_262094 [Daphnia pulex]|eukprot:EFX67116.1 hypothetical protein DAPPUDRAFT_262094 [Daphnia pulex]